MEHLVIPLSDKEEAILDLLIENGRLQEKIQNLQKQIEDMKSEFGEKHDVT
jgi:peptidoglycan hydrolase CwlO-like protein